MNWVITIDPAKCTGCQMCEVGCSLKHVQQCNPERSFVRVVKSQQAGQLAFCPLTCMQCETPRCELVCPTDANTRHPETGARVVDPDKCVGCSACSYACPFGACFVDRPLGRSVVCDQCEGDPTCVKVCPTGALEYTRADKVGAALRRAGASRLLEITLQPVETPIQSASRSKV